MHRVERGGAEAARAASWHRWEGLEEDSDGGVSKQDCKQFEVQIQLHSEITVRAQIRSCHIDHIGSDPGIVGVGVEDAEAATKKRK